MAVTGTPHAGLNRSQARRKKRKLTKAAARAATPVVLAIMTVTAQVTPSTEKSAGTDVLQTAACLPENASTFVTHSS